MTICCIGDSWTYGLELTDRANDSWPAVLSRLTGRTVLNQGREGCGNDRILKRIIDVAFDDKIDIVLIAWTNPARKEFFINKVKNIWPGHPECDNSITELVYQNTIAKTLTLSHNDDWDQWAMRKWYRDIILSQCLLEKHNKKYVMMSSFTTMDLSDRNKDLLDKIDFRYFLGYPVPPQYHFEMMSHWSAGYPIGPRSHPLKEGHQRIAERIYEYIRNLSWVS